MSCGCLSYTQNMNVSNIICNQLKLSTSKLMSKTRELVRLKFATLKKMEAASTQP